MAEPQDPVVSAVASVLEKLRTRTGLQEKRLYGTEVRLDPLVGLGSVQAQVTSGLSPERAIVNVVRAAAGSLNPTMCIVVDASLSLRLFADRILDGGLYADDLTDRRKAVIRNWDCLHELLSVPAGKPPSDRALRLDVETDALTALAVVLTASTATDRPFQVLPMAGEGVTRELRPDDATASREAQPLLRTFQDVGKALRAKLIRDADGVPTGWQQNLGGPQKEATAVSTAYGIRTMLLLEDRLAADLIPVAERLKGMAHGRGGYASSGHREPAAEATAAVLSALGRIAVTENFDTHLAQMERGLTEFEKARPFILTTMLEASLLLKEGGNLVGILVDSLLAARRDYDGYLVWPENSDPDLIQPKPSVAHTARAVRALADVRAIWPDSLLSELNEALEQAVAWLIEQTDLHNKEEYIERDPVVNTYHFTAAWVVKALVSAGKRATHPAVENAISLVWDSYAGGKEVALWSSDGGRLPIWTTFDAIEALRLASLAAPANPGSPR